MRPSWPARVLAAAAHHLDHRIGWPKLPPPLGILTLVGLRIRLRERNLFDTGVAVSTDPPDPRWVTARSPDGSHNDLSVPAMGARRARFGPPDPGGRSHLRDQRKLPGGYRRFHRRRRSGRSRFRPRRFRVPRLPLVRGRASLGHVRRGPGRTERRRSRTQGLRNRPERGRRQDRHRLRRA